MNYPSKNRTKRPFFDVCVILSSLLLFVPTFCNAQAAKLAAHRLGIVQADGRAGICSATAVGPRLLLTAAHCFGDGANPASMMVDGKPVGILAIERDGADHALVRVSVTFQYSAKLGRPPIQGDAIYYYGNPGIPDQFRRGYITGLFPAGGYLFDANCYMGDSGAGLFGADGLLKGVLSGFVTNGDFQLCIGYPLAFTGEQWARVK